MNLYRESRHFAGWFAGIIARLVRVKPVATITVIISASIARVTSLLLFFLPLKVILLAASDGVPRYFRGFIEPDGKENWIIGLAIGAVFLYVFNMLLDTASKRLTAAASQDVTRNANEIRILGNEDKTASTYYERFCRLAAGGLFIATGFAVGFLIWPSLFGLVALLTVGSAVFSGWVLAGSDVINPGRLKRYAQDRLGNFLRIFTAIIFLSSFFFILYPYLHGSQQNLLIAILSILIIRQVLSAMEASTQEAVRLYGEQSRVNALVFKQAHLERGESKRDRPVRALFGKSSRQRLARDLLEKEGMDPDSVEAVWQDSQFPGISTLQVTARDDDTDAKRHYQLQAYPPEQRHRLENETYLHGKVQPERLKAARTVTRFPVGPFDCRLLEFGTAESPGPDEWREWQSRLTVQLWSCQPPPGLVEAFSGSRPLLQRQLHAGSATRLEIAVDNAVEQDALRWFRDNLEEIRQRLAGYPLCIHNPELNRGTVVRTADDDIRIMSWGRWTLLPIGAVRPSAVRDDMLPGLLAHLREARDDVPEAFGESDLTFAARCYALQQNVARGQLKASLTLISEIQDAWQHP